ncbi:MAG: hypothetical protein HY551_06710, partial [Elusimicrobia bacterium]|nr:hypothetical protein [Elusimicrobiota bacterium]
MKKMKSSFLHRAALAGLLLIGHSAIARGATVTLEWDPVTTNEDGSAFTSPDDLTGYRLFQSTFSLLNRTTAQAMSDSAVTKSVVSAPNTSLAAAIPTDQTIYFRLTAFDASSNQSGFNVDSNNQDVQVSSFIAASPAPADTTPPTVSITAPANGALVSGSITITGT